MIFIYSHFFLTFSGWITNTTFSTLYVEGNEYMVGENGGALPSFLVPDDGSVMKYDGGYSCPGLKGKDGEYPCFFYYLIYLLFCFFFPFSSFFLEDEMTSIRYLIEVDPSYFNKSLCTYVLDSTYYTIST